MLHRFLLSIIFLAVLPVTFSAQNAYKEPWPEQEWGIGMAMRKVEEDPLYEKYEEKQQIGEVSCSTQRINF